jgi:hypothetical protein
MWFLLGITSMKVGWRVLMTPNSLHPSQRFILRRVFKQRGTQVQQQNYPPLYFVSRMLLYRIHVGVFSFEMFCVVVEQYKTWCVVVLQRFCTAKCIYWELLKICVNELLLWVCILSVGQSWLSWQCNSATRQGTHSPWLPLVLQQHIPTETGTWLVRSRLALGSTKLL